MAGFAVQGFFEGGVALAVLGFEGGFGSDHGCGVGAVCACSVLKERVMEWLKMSKMICEFLAVMLKRFLVTRNGSVRVFL